MRRLFISGFSLFASLIYLLFQLKYEINKATVRFYLMSEVTSFYPKAEALSYKSGLKGLYYTDESFWGIYVSSSSNLTWNGSQLVK